MGINFKNLSTVIAAVGITSLLNGAFAQLSSEKLVNAENVLNASTQTRYDFTVGDASPWNSTKAYMGGEVVEYGNFEGTRMYWTNSWWSQGEAPGEFADSGGVSPWNLINSQSFGEGSEYQWVGWNSAASKWEVTRDVMWEFTETQIGDWGDQIDKEGPGAYLPTWRDGAEGCYTIIHDNLGDMDIDKSVMPANEVGLSHPRIRVGWGAIVNKMDDKEWQIAKKMVMDGHEIVNHSYDHTSAGDQWQWFYHGDKLPNTDPSIPKEIMNLVVDSTGSNWQSKTIQIPTVDYISGDINRPETTYTSVTLQVSTNYQYKVDSTFNAEFGKYDYEYVSTGKVRAEHSGWSDQAGAVVKMLKLFCIPGWNTTRTIANIKGSNDVINAKLYSKVNSPRHPEGKMSEYYAYPYDAYSNELHDSLYTNGIIGARGGAKSGIPTPCDFYHPYRIDFDAFFMLDAHGETVFPDNPHQRISLKGLVDRVWKTKGYMIRSLHAVADVSYWDDANDKTKGGSWGGIPKSLYDSHFEYLDELIDNHKITVATPSEAVKYRFTANSVSNISITENTDNATVTVTASGTSTRYQDEISVIVVLNNAWDKMKVTYADGREPRYRARKMDTLGKAWSVSVNPYEQGGVVTLTKEDPTPITPVTYFDPADVTNFQITGTTTSGMSLSWTPSISNGVDTVLISWDEGTITDVSDALSAQHAYVDEGITSYSITGLTHSTKYNVKIFVKDTDNNWSIGVGDTASTAEINLHAPVSLNDTIALSEGATSTTLTSGELSLLTNDSDADGMKKVTANIVTSPSQGTISLNSNGTFRYTHNSSENFTDQFTYRANDGVHNGNVATVYITINPANDNAPITVVDTITLLQGGATTTLKNGNTSVLDNDSDIDTGDSLTVSLFDSTTSGSIYLNADGTFIYNHNNSEKLIDQFIYTATDKAGHTSSTKVIIILEEVNIHAPVSVSDTIKLAEGATSTTLTSGELSLLANDSDADRMAGVTAAVVTSPSVGIVTINSDGTFSYSHDGSESFTDQFTYKANDGVQDGNVATVYITISPVNDNTPVTFIDTIFLPQGEAITVLKNGSTSVLDNDTDIDLGDILTASLIDSTTNGFLSLNSDGTFLYKHNGQTKFTDNFIYNAVDIAGHSTAGLVVIIIDPVTAITEIGNSDSEITTFTAAPNPVTLDDGEVILVVPSDMHGEGEIAIYDHNSNLIDHNIISIKGNEIYRWDLRNQDGQKVCSGTYVALLRVKKDNGEIVTMKISIGVKK